MAVLREISLTYRFTDVSDDKIEQPLQYESKEKFLVVNLSSQHTIINYEVVAIGTVRQISLRPAEVLRTAILINASAVILIHNHSSGNPKPSREDYLFY